MRYRFTVNTDAYRCAPCSKRNWESGTRNMLAINGRTGIERNLREVRWLLDMLRGNTWISAEYSAERGGMSERYETWLNRKSHVVRFTDRLCGFDRTQHLSGYGFMQGYFDIDEAIRTLRNSGVVRVPFSALYDIRQYDHAMDGCYMEIRKCA